MSENIQSPFYDPTRIAFTVPDFEKFGEMLHDRLHAAFYHFEEIDSTFMLITNLFDRDAKRVEKEKSEDTTDIETLTYCGTIRQRAILEKKDPVYCKEWVEGAWSKAVWKKQRDKNWAALKYTELRRDMEQVETFGFFDAFRQGELKTGDIKVSSLREYFEVLDNVLQVNEYPIISDYFDIQKDKYIGIPLLGMGLFQGIVWIVFDHEEEYRFKEIRDIKKIIKLFEYIYDDLVLSWDIAGTNMVRKSIVGRSVNEVKESNPIQVDCRTKKYYEISQNYFNQRIEQNDAVVDRLRSQYQKTSIITILLDSYAHNISAHSLTTLSWWFRERAEYRKEGKEVIEALGRDSNPLIGHYNKLPKGGLSHELYRVFKFLLEKGAFWSGITRQTNFSGKISNLYNILWHDFINNSLYLGTIANTEEVKKIHIKISIYEAETVGEDRPLLNTKKVKKSSTGKLLDGIFATVNFDDFDPEKAGDNDSVFIEKGELYPEISKELMQFNAFFPGGIVGKHAFFTLLENEIRNVKHFKGEALSTIQKDGLILNVSIHERPVDSENPKQRQLWELYKIGVWLHHPVKIDAALLVKRIKDLDANIVNEDTFQPRLGGNYQDKICASLLMNNTFDMVQNKETRLGMVYYPWIKTASSKIHSDQSAGENVEFEISHRRYIKVGDDLSEEFATEAGQGYLKKYFHLWKGADILRVDDDFSSLDTEMENSSRFHFLQVPDQNTTLKNRFKSDGLIRILPVDNQTQTLHHAYQKWLPLWIKHPGNNTDTVFDFKEGATYSGRILYKQGKVRFYSYDQIRNLSAAENERYKKISNKFEINIAHGSKLSVEKDKLNYRSHGQLLCYFCEGKKFDLVEHIPPDKLYDLFEALSTRICIVDNRIYHRFCSNEQEIKKDPSWVQKNQLQLDRLDLYRRQLSMDFRNESIEHWNVLKRADFLTYNFAVVHLSFIESLGYSEANIISFIDEHILDGRNPDEVGDNFILIITTGRGRMAWWEAVKSDPRYARFVNFRPIESILGVVENALELPDDIDLKYNLVKLFFGS